MCQGVIVPPQSKMTAPTLPVMSGSGRCRRTSAITSATAEPTGTTRRSPERRSLTSTVPSARPRPTTTMVGTPISSESLNFTPGLTWRRSS